MKPGDVIHVQSLRAVRPGQWIGYKARPDGEPRVKGKTPVFVLIVLGLDIMEDPQLDPNEALKGLGWRPPEDAADAPLPEPGDHRVPANAMIEDDFDAFARAELAAWEERDKEGRP